MSSRNKASISDAYKTYIELSRRRYIRATKVSIVKIYLAQISHCARDVHDSARIVEELEAPCNHSGVAHAVRAHETCAGKVSVEEAGIA
eukprot:IDg13731t1